MQSTTGVPWRNRCIWQRKKAPRGPGVRQPRRIKLNQALPVPAKEVFLGMRGRL